MAPDNLIAGKLQWNRFLSLLVADSIFLGPLGLQTSRARAANRLLGREPAERRATGPRPSRARAEGPLGLLGSFAGLRTVGLTEDPHASALSQSSVLHISLPMFPAKTINQAVSPFPDVAVSVSVEENATLRV